MKEKIVLVGIFLVLIFSLVGCSNKNQNQSTNSKDQTVIERLQTENIQIESFNMSLQTEEILSDVKARLGNIVYIVESNQQKKIYMSGKNNTKKSGNNILDYNLDISGNVYFIASEDHKDKTDFFLENLIIKMMFKN